MFNIINNDYFLFLKTSLLLHTIFTYYYILLSLHECIVAKMLYCDSSVLMYCYSEKLLIFF